jgi:hypothetical protein
MKPIYDTYISSPELRLLLISSYRNTDEKDSNTIFNIINESVNWSRFFKYLQQHRLIPYVYDNLSKYKHLLPNEILLNLKKLNEQNTLHMLLLISETIRLLKIFDANNLWSMPLKGPVLAFQLYDDFSKRSSRDVDILIQPSDILKAVDILSNEGYKIIPEGTTISKNKFEILKKIKHNISLYNSIKNVYIELHWRLSFHNYFTEGDYNFSQLPIKLLKIYNSEIKIFRDDLQLLYLAVHGSKHKWSALYWLKDFNDFLNKYDVINSSIKLVVKTGTRRSLLQAMKLSQIFYGYKLPFEFKISEKLLTPVFIEINSPSPSGIINDLRRVFYFMKLRPNLFYKIGCIGGIFYRFVMRLYLKMNHN